MTLSRFSLKALAIAAVLVAVAGAMLLFGRPQPIESAVLGADWECTQTVFVVTTCAPRAIPAVETLRNEAVRATRG